MRSTATDAIQHDVNPYIVVGDACCDRHADHHNSHPSQVWRSGVDERDASSPVNLEGDPLAGTI